MPHAQALGQMTTTTQSPSSSPNPPQSSSSKLDIIAKDQQPQQQSHPADSEAAAAATTATANNDENNHHNNQVMETQTVNLIMCLYGGKDGTVEQSFDKKTTLDEIQQELRKLYSISSDREIKLWVNANSYPFKPSEEPTSTSNNFIYDQALERLLLKGGHVKSTDNGNHLNNSEASVDHSENFSVPPPTPPPMPNFSAADSPASSSSKGANDASSPSPIVTRQQVANSTSSKQPIALPDSTTFTTDDDVAKTTLAEILVTETAVVTLEVINADGTWPSSKPRGAITTRSSKAQPGLCGLSNMGNTCFMNAALQCLSNTPPLTDYILSNKFIDDINTNNPLGMHGEIARTYAELIKVIWSGNNSSFLPREFKCAVSRFAPQFTGFAQQDCQELMAFLLDGLHEDLNRIKNKPYIEVKSDDERRPDEEVAKESWANYKKRNDSIVVDTFHALLKSTLVCPECQLVSVTFDPFCYLSLPLPVKREKQVNLTFIPAPGKLDESRIKTVLDVLDPEDVKTIMNFGGRVSSFDGTVEEHAGYSNSKNRPKGCKISVPRTGPASELCEIVARVFNDEKSYDDESGSVKFEAENLVVAELAVGRITKIYEPSEHYNSISDDIVVVEKASKYVLPLYLKEKKSSSDSSYGMSKLLFLHTPDLKYETLYKSIITSLSNLTSDSVEELKHWYRLNPPTELETESRMECDDNNHIGGEDETSRLVVSTDDIDIDDSDEVNSAPATTNGKSLANNNVSKTKQLFDLNIVNSFGNHSFEQLGPNRKECDYSSKLYLGATFSTDIASSVQFEHNRAPKSESVDTFTPRVMAKPTLQLKDCITQFTNAERLGADDPWYCPKCKKHQQAIKKFDVWSLPKVLIIHLKRFSFSRSWRDKIDTFVEFPVDGLDMSSYVHNPEQKKQKQIYNLIGVANHFGGLGGGHYTAYAKNSNLDAWYSFDDSLVTPTSGSNVITRSAYVLFYQLQEE